MKNSIKEFNSELVSIGNRADQMEERLTLSKMEILK